MDSIFSITGLHHASRTIADMDRSLDFYRDLLGMALVLDTEMKGEMLEREVALPGAHLRLALLRNGEGPFLELLQYYAPNGSSLAPGAGCADIGAHHVALLVSDISASFTVLSEAGVRFTAPPQEVDSGFFRGHWTAYCYDPDALVVELWQAPPS